MTKLPLTPSITGILGVVAFEVITFFISVFVIKKLILPRLSGKVRTHAKLMGWI